MPALLASELRPAQRRGQARLDSPRTRSVVDARPRGLPVPELHVRKSPYAACVAASPVDAPRVGGGGAGGSAIYGIK